MLSVTNTKEGVIIHVLVPNHGYPVEIVSDVWHMLHLIHSNMRRESPEAADIFRMMISGITYEASPLWHEQKKPAPEAPLNMKVVCCDNSRNDCFTTGKVYEIKDGWITDDNGVSVEVEKLCDLCGVLNVHMVELKE